MRRLPPAARVMLSLALGLAGGILLASGSLPPPVRQPVVSFIEPIGTLWVNAIRMTVIPLVVPLLLVAVASGDARRIGGLSLRVIAVFFGMLITLAGVTALVAPSLFASLTLDPASTAALRAQAQVIAAPAEEFTFRSWAISVVPVNPIKAAADGAMLPVVLFTLLYGFALGRAGPDTRTGQVRFFRGVSDVMMVMVRWVLAMAPLGVFALALALGFRLGVSAIGALVFFIGVCIGFHVAAAIPLYALAVLSGRVSLARFARAVLPAQAVAFSSRSSLASLPALIEGARDHLGLSGAATGFILPLAVSTFKVSGAIYWTIGALFVARLYGIDLGASRIATIATASVVLNAATPGIPSGGLLIQAPLYAAVGVPVEGLGILLAIDTVPDMFRTAFNVTADMAVASLLGSSEPVEADVGQIPLQQVAMRRGSKS